LRRPIYFRDTAGALFVLLPLLLLLFEERRECVATATLRPRLLRGRLPWCLPRSARDSART